MVRPGSLPSWPRKNEIPKRDWIDFDKLIERLKAFYSHWNDNKAELWASTGALVISTPPPSEELRFLKSSAFCIWLFGFELPGIVMVFMKKQIHFLCNKKKSRLLRVVEKAARYGLSAQLVIHVRKHKKKKKKKKKKKNDGAMKSIIHDLGNSPVVGLIASDTWGENRWIEGFQVADISAGLADLFAVKDDDELLCVRRSAYLSSNVLKKMVVPKLQYVIDHPEEKDTLVDETRKAILQPAMKAGVELLSKNVDICYPPKFEIYCSNESPSVITCSIGSQYKGYCSNVARSFLIDANAFQTKAYEALLKAHEAAIAALRPGNRISAAYEAACSLISYEAPELATHLTESAGKGIGLELFESGLGIDGTNDALVKAGMVFNVSLGLQNVKEINQNNFSLLLADTIIVCTEENQVVTQASLKAVEEVTYPFFIDDGGREDEKWQPRYLWDEKLSRWRHQAEFLTPDKKKETEERLKLAIGVGNNDLEEVPAERGPLLPEKLKLVDRKYSGAEEGPMRLSDFRICHPEFGRHGRKLPWALEAHANGFRCFSPWQDDDDYEQNVGDIFFSNIKHAIFHQEGYGEKFQMSIIHFSLHNPILVGNVETKDVQLYADKINEHHGRGDGPSAIGRKNCKKFYLDCQCKWRIFVDHVDYRWERGTVKNLHFELNSGSTGFHGVLPQYMSSALFFVLTYGCLVQLTESPFLVVELDEIEIVTFERVVEEHKDFDINIVFKDLKKDVLRIECIPNAELNYIQEGLDRADVKFYETEFNLNWQEILKSITDDPYSFIDRGCWDFLASPVEKKISAEVEQRKRRKMAKASGKARASPPSHPSKALKLG